METMEKKDAMGVLAPYIPLCGLIGHYIWDGRFLPQLRISRVGIYSVILLARSAGRMSVQLDEDIPEAISA